MSCITLVLSNFVPVLYLKIKYKNVLIEISPIVGVELYDHKADPQENHNRAFDKSFSSLRKQLSEQLHKGWRHALPPSRV